MLTDKEIILVAGIYLAIGGGLMPGSVCKQLVQSVKQHNNEQYAYFMLLLNRWKYELRSHRTHLPTRINRSISLNNTIYGFST